MKERSKILVLDNSKNTENLLTFAIQWADLINASIRVIRVIDEKVIRNTTMAVDAIGTIAQMIKDDFIKEAREQIKTLSERYRVNDLINIEVIVGNTRDEITRTIDKSGADFLILTSNLKGPLGSIASEVIGYSKNNCIVLPIGVHQLKWERVLLATDCSEKAESATEMAMEIAERFKGRLFIVSVVTSNEEVQIHAPALLDKMADERKEMVKEIENQARKRGIHAEGIVREGTISNILIDLNRTVHPDVTIMGSESRTGLSRILMGSVVGSIINKVNHPILVIKKTFVFKNDSRERQD
ncbi:MAG: universal stress protein [Nitrospirae bacterium]|nr:universal stress protein [Nitrospirota bacterium]